MANILFKKGSYSNFKTNVLDANKVQEGALYLIDDIGELYLGLRDNSSEVKRVQGSVLYFDTLQSFTQSVAPPYPTDLIYFIANDNALVRWDGTKWIQLNKNDNDNTYVKIETISFGNSYNDSSDDDIIKYDLTLTQKEYDALTGQATTRTLDDLKATLEISGEALASIVPEASSVGLDVAAEGAGVAIGTVGTGSDTSKKVSLTGDTNVAVSVDGTNIKISATDTTYTLGAVKEENDVKVRMSSSAALNQDVAFTAGQDLVCDLSDNKIVYSHDTIDTEKTETTNENATLLSHEGYFDAITDVTISNGHVEGVKVGRFKLPEDNYITEIINSNNKDWLVTLKDANGNEKEISFASDANALKEELQEVITNGLAAANTALTYKGTISKYEDLLNKSQVEVGDVWLSDKDFVYDQKAYKAGDMFIATSENSTETGVITGTVIWTYIPSGDEINTDTKFYGTVTFDSTKDQVTYTLEAEGGDGQVPTGNTDFVLKAGQNINITQENDSTVAIIEHDKITTTESNGDAGSKSSFTAITDLDISNGHITGITAKTFTPETYALKKAEGSNTTFELVNSSGAGLGAIEVSGDEWITTSVSDKNTNDNNAELTIAHKATADSGKTVQAENTNPVLSAESTFNIISSVQYDDAGHVVAVNTQGLTLPQDTTYNFITASNQNGTTVANNTANPYLTLVNNNGLATYTRLIGNSSDSESAITITGNSDSIKFNLEWGTF